MINTIKSFSQLKKYCLENGLSKPKKTNIKDLYAIEYHGVINLIKKEV